jgi:hypothetical protein
MKTILSLVLLVLIGCAGPRPKPVASTPVLPTAKLGVTGARITRLHAQHKFVVLDFTSRVMPPVGTKLPVYRGTERVGEVQLTEPVRATFATADILSGDLIIGDEAR